MMKCMGLCKLTQSEVISCSTETRNKRLADILQTTIMKNVSQQWN